MSVKKLFFVSLIFMNISASSESSLVLYKGSQAIIAMVGLASSVYLGKNIYKNFNQNTKKMDQLRKELSLKGIVLMQTVERVPARIGEIKIRTTLKFKGEKKALEEQKERIDLYWNLQRKADSGFDKLVLSTLTAAISAIFAFEGVVIFFESVM